MGGGFLQTIKTISLNLNVFSPQTQLKKKSFLHISHFIHLVVSLKLSLKSVSKNVSSCHSTSSFISTPFHIQFSTIFKCGLIFKHQHFYFAILASKKKNVRNPWLKDKLFFPTRLYLSEEKKTAHI